MPIKTSRRRTEAQKPARAASSADAQGRAKQGRKAPKPAIADRRGHILRVAAKRFAQYGFEATTVRQIADDIDILSGSLYHHFATKDEMLHQIVRDAALRMRDNAIRIARAQLDAEYRLVALILLDLGELTRDQLAHAILYNERKLFRRGEQFRDVVAAKKQTYLAWKAVLRDGVKAKLFKPDIDFYLTISTILRMLNTAADWYNNEDDSVMNVVGAYSIDQVIDFHLDFALSAVRAPSRIAEPIPRQACLDLARPRI
jgi:TetR/AcrR family transcriptional regulator, cholesterol catabolism regulator